MLNESNNSSFILADNLGAVRNSFIGAAVLLLFFLIYGAINFPEIIQGTDFSSIFYTAAHMIKDGHYHELYSDPNPTSFGSLAFNQYAHKWLPNMSPSSAAIFLYPPLVGFLIQPLAYFSLHKAYLLWLSLSIAALLICSLLVLKAHKKDWRQLYFFFSLLYAPLLGVLIEGQVDLLFTLLPLSIGYYLFMRGHPLIAGAAWSVLSLKPQFLPAIFLFVAAYTLSGKWKIFVGFSLGILTVITGNIFCFGSATVYQWLACLQNRLVLEDYIYPKAYYLVSSLPMILFKLFPAGMKPLLQGIVYFLILAVLAHGTFICIKLIRKAGSNYIVVAPSIFVLGVFVLPIISRYLLFYNLSILAIAVMVAFGDPFLSSNKKLMKDLIIVWCLINLYIASTFTHAFFCQPPILIAFLIWLYIRFISVIQSSATDSDKITDDA